MSILSDISLLHRLASRGPGALGVEPHDVADVGPASIDLHLAPRILTIRPAAIADGVVYDPLAPDPDIWEERTISVGGFVLQPGACVLGATIERVAIPRDLVAQLWGKSTIGRCFVLIHATAGYGDPGFVGDWTLEIKNLFPVPVRLWPGMAIGQMNCTETDRPVAMPYSRATGHRYAEEAGPTPARPPVPPGGDP